MAGCGCCFGGELVLGGSSVEHNREDMASRRDDMDEERKEYKS